MAGKGLQVFFVFYVAKILGADQFGNYNFAREHVAIYMLIATWGMEVLGTREIAKDKSQVKDLVNNIFSIRFPLTVILYSVLSFMTFFVWDLEPLTKTMLMISGATIFSMSFLLNWVYQGLEKMGIFALRSFIAAILNLAGVLLLVHGPEDSLTVMIVVQVSMMINTIWMLIYYSREFGFPKFVFDREKWFWILKYSFAIGLAYWVVKLYNTVDINMMVAFLGDSDPQTGHLSIAHQFVIVGILPAQVIQMAFFPQLVDKLDSPDKDRTLSVFVQIMVILAFFTAGFIAIFPEELGAIILNEYPNIPSLLVLFSGTMFFTFFAILFNTPLMAWGKEKLCLIGNIGGLTANFILNLILIPKYGMYGAATATIVCEATVMIILGYFFKKQTGHLYLGKLHVWILVAICSLLPGYAVKNYLNMPFVAIGLSLVLFIAMNFAFKTITPNQLKSIIKK
jgi:O-antigen/teichoic acid export membrane protein